VQRDATVTLCHHHTRNLPASTRGADIVVVAVEGRAGGLTPVPGGVGPVTTALLLANTGTAATDLHVRAQVTAGELVGSAAL
jgi:methylenetetrahydrofolate dehydrogenase (NADP+)/methenyltetrahydrofolate cyclohydrolase